MIKKIFQMLTCRLILVLIVVTTMGFTFPQAGEDTAPQKQKRALAILGDAWHAVAPLYFGIVQQMERKGYQTDVVVDNNVPFDNLEQYDLIVISRYGMDDKLRLEKGMFTGPEGKNVKWLTIVQEKYLEHYVLNGGKILLHHDGHSYYSEDGGICNLAKATHKGHPKKVTVKMEPTGVLPELTTGIEPFETIDEEFRMELDESTTNIFLKSYSKENGTTNQGWAHNYGKGKVVVFVPGHDSNSLENPMIRKCISNCIDWLNE